MLRTIPALLPALLLLTPVLPPPAAPAPTVATTGKNGPAETQLELALTALDEDDGEAALAAAELGLEYAPEHAGLLDAASQAAAEMLQEDVAVRYALLGLRAPGSEDYAEKLQARIAELCPDAVEADRLLNEYAEQLFQLGKLCFRRKLYVNACDFYTRCQGTPAAADANKQLERLYGNKKATQAMIDSGLDVPFRPKRKKTAKQIAKEDKDHVKWEEAWELEGKYYTVHSNMGYVMTEDMLNAMEQVNLFYRSVFKYKMRGGGTRRCHLYVYKSRKEFDRYEGDLQPTIKGFFRPGATTVHTYDPRTEGGTLASLWSTLFHEASHQFTRLVLPNDCPTWLNEGTASYFEGAKLMQNGSIRTNLIPDGRLRNLDFMLKKKGDSRFPSLTDVVTHFEGGSYPGEYYPFGWGLVYFMRNYEDTDGERIYVEPYLDFMAAYKGGGQHDVLGRFVDYFVKQVKDPEVKTLDDFEARWTAWIHDLADIHFGPPEKADILIARGRKQREQGKLEAAADSFEWAVRKRPEDPLALFELAEVQASLKEKDAATYNLRRALEAARAHAPEDQLAGFDKNAAQVVEACLDKLQRQDKELSSGLESTDEAFATAIVERARAMHEGEFHYLALDVLDRASTAVGGAAALDAVADEIREKAGIDGRRWRRLVVDEDLVGWEPSPDWEVSGETLSCDTPRLSRLLHGDPVTGDYRFEATFTPKGKGQGLFGILFGSDDESDDIFMIDSNGIASLLRRAEEDKPLKAFGRVKLDEPVQLAIEVKGRKIEFFANGKEIGKRSDLPSNLEGKLGVFAQDTKVEAQDLRLLR